MAFSKKTWKNRVSQYINRRLLTDSDGNTQQVTVTRDEGSVTEAGDAFSASNMNDLEDRIEDAFDGLTAADIPYSSGVSVADKLDNLNGLIKIETFEATNVSISGNNFTNISANAFSYSVPTGYTPICIKKTYPNNYSVFMYRYDLNASGAGTLLALTNLSSTSLSSISISIDVVFIKTAVI